MAKRIVQTPDELLNWSIDWAERGLGDETIVTSEFVPSSIDFTISGETIDDPPTSTTFLLTGGVAGNTYQITNNIITSGGLELSETVNFFCVEENLIGAGCQ